MKAGITKAIKLIQVCNQNSKNTANYFRKTKFLIFNFMNNSVNSINIQMSLKYVSNVLLQLSDMKIIRFNQTMSTITVIYCGLVRIVYGAQ